MTHPLFPRILALALAASLALVAAGCSDKNNGQKTRRGPTVVKTDWKGRWDKITAKGEEGKHFIKQGLSIVQSATTPDGRDKGYKDMVNGLNTISKAVTDGEDLIQQFEEKNAGEHRPEWEETLTSWTEEASKARKNLPDEYIDMVD